MRARRARNAGPSALRSTILEAMLNPEPARRCHEQAQRLAGIKRHRPPQITARAGRARAAGVVVDEHVRRRAQAVGAHQCRHHYRLVVAFGKPRHVIQIHRPCLGLNETPRAGATEEETVAPARGWTNRTPALAGRLDRPRMSTPESLRYAAAVVAAPRLPAGAAESPVTKSATRSPIMIAGAFVLPVVTIGITEASATRSPSTPLTRRR